ncbi:YqhG family protein [Paenibacillus sp. sgz500958]|uniref:YqhG family protein n=1 Tax=Paenibacillus sp. sgz500958 TaxID=3242475 RepID=UPI0036D3C114
MTLSLQEIRTQVVDYLEATESTILEQSPHHVTVKLSPRADRMLTDRPYYWGFVERTGVEPETLSFTFVFDPEQYDDPAARIRQPTDSAVLAPPAGASPNVSSPNVSLPGALPNPQDGILARYFGVTPMVPRIGPGLVRREDVTYGSRRLRQIWSAAREEGKCLHLFEVPASRQRNTLFSASYEPWLGVCFKVEMSCDLKCEQLNFLGISLASGAIIEDFSGRIGADTLQLTPRLPENVHIQPYQFSLTTGTDKLEEHLTSRLSEMDFSWAEEARERLQLELAIIDVYYEDLLKEPDEEKRQLVQEQYTRRRNETIWQYEPRITVSAVTYGLFHLRST